LLEIIFDGKGVIIGINNNSKFCLGRVAFERELMVSVKK
jgi:hypothetical protein